MGAQNIGATLGTALGGAFGPLAGFLGGGLGGALGGLFGSDYKKPAGTISTDQVLKLLRQGMSPDDIAKIAPMSSRYMVRSQKKLMQAGLTQDQIQLMRAGPEQPDPQAGSPASMGAFQGLLPAVFSNPSAFSSPEAANWLGSVFGVSPQTGQPIPAPSAPAPTSLATPLALGAPGGFTPWNSFAGKGTPGPSPDPFTGLRSLAGPFGNGGGALLPTSTGKRSGRY